MNGGSMESILAQNFLIGKRIVLRFKAYHGLHILARWWSMDNLYHREDGGPAYESLRSRGWWEHGKFLYEEYLD